MKRILVILLVALLPLLAASSCQLFATDEKVEFALPDWPDYLPQLFGWELQVEGADGQALRKELAPHTKKISLCLDKNKPCCIIA